MFLESLELFENRFFLDVPLHKEVRAMVCTLSTGMEDIGISLFHKYVNKGHFLTGNELYAYKEDDLSQKELYLNKRMVTSIKELCHARGVTPQNKASRKCLKWFINTHLLMETRVKEKRKVVFYEF